MLTVSKRARYGLRVMLFLAEKNRLASVKEIAHEEEISVQFLEQIIYELKKNGLVNSQRGKYGGYYLAKPSKEISMGDVVRLLEKEICLSSCLAKTAEPCSLEEDCFAKQGWNKVQKSILQIMDSTSLADLLSDKKN